KFKSFSVRKYATEQDAADLARAVESVVKKTFHYHLLGADLTTNNHVFVSNLTTWGRHGWLRAYVLFGDEKPIAYAIGYLIERRFQYEQIGYDPELARSSPGTYLLSRIVEDLIESKAADLLDFGSGDADYKRLFGNRSYEEGTMLLTRRTLYAQSAARAERLFA